MLLIITSTGDGIFRLINIDDLKRPWTSKISFWWFFGNVWL